MAQQVTDIVSSNIECKQERDKDGSMKQHTIAESKKPTTQQSPNTMQHLTLRFCSFVVVVKNNTLTKISALRHLALFIKDQGAPNDLEKNHGRIKKNLNVQAFLLRFGVPFALINILSNFVNFLFCFNQRLIIWVTFTCMFQ